MQLMMTQTLVPFYEDRCVNVDDDFVLLEDEADFLEPKTGAQDKA